MKKLVLISVFLGLLAYVLTLSILCNFTSCKKFSELDVLEVILFGPVSFIATSISLIVGTKLILDQIKFITDSSYSRKLFIKIAVITLFLSPILLGFSLNVLNYFSSELTNFEFRHIIQIIKRSTIDSYAFIFSSSKLALPLLIFSCVYSIAFVRIEHIFSNSQASFFHYLINVVVCLCLSVIIYYLFSELSQNRFTIKLIYNPIFPACLLLSLITTVIYNNLLMDMSVKNVVT